MNKKTLLSLLAVVVLIIVGVVAFGALDDDGDKMEQKDNTSLSSDEDQMMEEDTVMVGGAAMFPSKNIIENVSNADNLTTLVAAVQAADLVETLSGPGPFTVFGPNNDAFDALPAGTLDTLLLPENKDRLTDILTYHVVPGIYTTDDLMDGQTLTTVNGQTLDVTKSASGMVMVNGVSIETPDVLQSNGVAHVIDEVLLPEETVEVGGAAMFPSKTIVENVSNASNLTTLVAAVQAADLVETLNGDGPFTVFGPDNAAFEALPAGTVDSLLLPENKAQLQGVLTYHVVPGLYTTDDLTDGQTLTTVNGAELRISKQGNQVMINDSAMIQTPDVLQSNGVAHVIDAVLLPPQ